MPVCLYNTAQETQEALFANLRRCCSCVCWKYFCHLYCRSERAVYACVCVCVWSLHLDAFPNLVLQACSKYSIKTNISTFHFAQYFEGAGLRTIPTIHILFVLRFDLQLLFDYNQTIHLHVYPYILFTLSHYLVRYSPLLAAIMLLHNGVLLSIKCYTFVEWKLWIFPVRKQQHVP